MINSDYMILSYNIINHIYIYTYDVSTHKLDYKSLVYPRNKDLSGNNHSSGWFGDIMVISPIYLGRLRHTRMLVVEPPTRTILESSDDPDGGTQDLS